MGAIDELSSRLKDLNSENTMCMASLTLAQKICDSLNTCRIKISLVREDMKEFLDLDSKVVGDANIKKADIEVEDALKTLKNHVIPSIKDRISSINREITRLNYEINK